ncbi:hypothetical protein [Mycobacterium sp. SMC-19]|uniref:hypothetical protein n=1 Tax=Mycobacterium sp. SMC-19 TaxID=3381630 RepID=UPI00387776D6
MSNPSRIVVRYAMDGEDLYIDPAGLSLLFGVPQSSLAVGAEHPPELWRQACRRIKEAEAHGSGHGLGPVLAYYADLERDGAELVLVELP